MPGISRAEAYAALDEIFAGTDTTQAVYLAADSASRVPVLLGILDAVEREKSGASYDDIADFTALALIVPFVRDYLRDRAGVASARRAVARLAAGQSAQPGDAKEPTGDEADARFAERLRGSERLKNSLSELGAKMRKRARPAMINTMSDVFGYKIDAARGLVVTDAPLFQYAELTGEARERFLAYQRALGEWTLNEIDRAEAAKAGATPPPSQDRPPVEYPRVEDFFPLISWREATVEGETARLATGEGVVALPTTPVFRYCHRVTPLSAIKDFGREAGPFMAGVALLFERGKSEPTNLTATAFEGPRIAPGSPSETPRLLTERAPPLFVTAEGKSNIREVVSAAKTLAEKVMSESDFAGAATITQPFVEHIGTGAFIRRVNWSFDGNGARTVLELGVDPKHNKYKNRE